MQSSIFTPLSISTGRTPLLSTRRIHQHECGTTPGQCASASVNHPCGCACSTEDSCDQQPSAAGKFRRGIRPSAPTSCDPPPFATHGNNVPNVGFPFELPPLFPRIIVRPVLPFYLNVNLQPFLECHCPCTSFLPRLVRTTSGERAPPVCLHQNRLPSNVLNTCSRPLLCVTL